MYAMTDGSSLPLALAQANQRELIESAYAAAIAADVSFTTGAGVTKIYQADADSQSSLKDALIGFTPAGATPSGFYWRSLDNTNVPFTLADLQGLAQAMLGQGWAAFQKRISLLEQVAAATTTSQVEAIMW